MAGGLDTVEPGHRHVHQDDIRMQFCGHFHRLLTVARFTDQFDLRLLVQDIRQPFAQQGMIVGHQDAQTLRGGRRRSRGGLGRRRGRMGRRGRARRHEDRHARPLPWTARDFHLPAQQTQPFADAEHAEAAGGGGRFLVGIEANAVVAHFDTQTRASPRRPMVTHAWRARACLATFKSISRTAVKRKTFTASSAGSAAASVATVTARWYFSWACRTSHSNPAARPRS